MLITVAPDLADWSNAARWLIQQEIAPEAVEFAVDGEEGAGDLLTVATTPCRAPATPSSFHVPREFVEVAKMVVFHRSPERFALLYRMLWRVMKENRRLLEMFVDPDVRQVRMMQKAVRNDEHRMHAFVRFRKLMDESGSEHWVAWHRPDHRIVRLAAPFFAERFHTMKWLIMTPDESVSWDGVELHFSAGTPTPPAGDDDLERLWRSYYRSVSNPARANPALLFQHLPVRHWATLPESREIRSMLSNSVYRTESMLERSAPAEEASARAVAAAVPDLESLAGAVAVCTACPLYCNATQAVAGEGPRDASVMLVGEQPGKEEDLQGRPFVGPAGQLLNEALGLAGLDRSRMYVTNAMKHFKFEQSGDRRLDRPPNSAEIGACRPWLARESALVRPEVLVCLGASAAQSVFGRRVILRDVRGRFHRTALCDRTYVTVHPSSILRTPSGPAREEAWRRFMEDLHTLAAGAADNISSDGN